MFERIKTKKLKFSANSLKGRYDEKFNLPALTAGVNNQGLAFYVPRDEATILKNVISVSANGANTGVMFYQPYDFTVLQDSYAIKFKDKKLTDNQYLFFVSCLQKRVRYNFDYSNKAGWEKIKNEIIVIPVYHNEDIAFDFMEDYILQLKIENFHKLKLHLEVCGLLDCKLTEKEKKYFDIIGNDNRGRVESQKSFNCILWKEFKIGDLFVIKSNPQLNKDSFVFKYNAPYPYFTRTCLNNGVAGYVEFVDNEHKILGNSIAVGMLGMQFFYMEKDFYAGQFTKTIYSKNFILNSELALYFCVLFNKYSEIFKGVLVRDFEKIFYNSIITLPVNSNGDINFDFMETFIKAIQKEAVKDVILYNEERIQAAKKIIIQQ